MRKSLEEVEVAQTCKLNTCKKILNRDAGYQVLVGQGGHKCIILCSTDHEKTSYPAAISRFQSAIRRKNEEMKQQLAKDR